MTATFPVSVDGCSFLRREDAAIGIGGAVRARCKNEIGS